MWKKVATFSGASVLATGAVGYYNCHPSVNWFDKRSSQYGKEPELPRWPAEMEFSLGYSAINNVGDILFNLFGYEIVTLKNSNNVSLLDKLAEYVGEEEMKEQRESLELESEVLSIKKGFAPMSVVSFNYLFGLMLEGRLEVEKFVKEHPEVEETVLKRQLIITGQPRTGSTFLQHLLAQDTNARTLRGWEQMRAVPPPTKETYLTDPRIKQIREQGKDAERLVPGFSTVLRKQHDNDGTGVEEEFYVLFQGLNLSFLPIIAGEGPEYFAFLMRPDKHYVYNYLKKFLQMSQLYNPPKTHWVLKTPLHGFHFKELLETFDDSTIIITHRAPQSTVPSASLLFQTTILGACRSKEDYFWDRRTLGLGAARFNKTIIQNIEKARQEILPATGQQIIDIDYRDLVKYPIETVKYIYDRTGLEFSPEYEERLQRFLEEGKKRRAQLGRYERSLADFGLTDEFVVSEFKDYIDKYCSPEKDLHPGASFHYNPV